MTDPREDEEDEDDEDYFDDEDEYLEDMVERVVNPKKRENTDDFKKTSR